VLIGRSNEGSTTTRTGYAAVRSGVGGRSASETRRCGEGGRSIDTRGENESPEATTTQSMIIGSLADSVEVPSARPQRSRSKADEAGRSNAVDGQSSLVGRMLLPVDRRVLFGDALRCRCIRLQSGARRGGGAPRPRIDSDRTRRYATIVHSTMPCVISRPQRAWSCRAARTSVDARNSGRTRHPTIDSTRARVRAVITRNRLRSFAAFVPSR
jgi:hypothetical protein